MATEIFAGTSGFAYDEWKGGFYPEDLAAADRLTYYAQRLPAVEINNTFYRLPKRHVVESWGVQVPDRFRFVIKASRRITHQKKLADAGSELEFLLGNLSALGEKLGAVLFQLPPYLRKDVPRLASFLEELPTEVPAAFEFRHASWLDDEVLDCLRAANRPLVISESDEEPDVELVSTASWGYLRLRRCDYTDEELAARVERVRAEGWERALVFFKHEEDGAGPELAERFGRLAAEK